jgi:hypothetical protein
MAKTNLIQLITSLEIDEVEDSGRVIENDYPEHGVHPTDLETRGCEIDHHEP